MAVKRKARGKAERRTAPAKGAKARGAVKRRNRPAEKRKVAARKAPIFHTIDAGEFVSTPEEGGTHFGPRKGQLTSCCGKPLTRNISVATSTREVSSVKWCPKVTF